MRENIKLVKLSSKWYDDCKADVLKALADEKLRTAIDRATVKFSDAKRVALAKLPHMPYVYKRLREVKTYSIDHVDELIKILKENTVNLGGVFHLARDAEELNEYVCKVVQDHNARLVVKGKSLTTEETFLNDALQKIGVEVVETDLGERIIQLRNEKPSHFIVPAVHIPREDVAELFSEVTGRRLPPDISALTLCAREMLREKFITADIGITGANVIAAHPGTIFLITNEGNGRFVSNAPPVHICVTGIEKIVPTIEDAMVVVQALPPNATGQLMSCYVSLITGPSRTADIELTTTIGVHGPKELYLCLLDNGRSRMFKDPDFKAASYCIRCGSCLNDCPIYREIGGQVMGYRYVGGIGAILTAFFHGLDKAAPFVYACTTCGACTKVCPLEIDVPGMIEKLRARLVKAGYVTPPHAKIADWIEQYHNPFGESPDKRMAWFKA